MVKFGAQDTISNFMTKVGCAAVFQLVASRCLVVEYNRAVINEDSHS